MNPNLPPVLAPAKSTLPRPALVGRVLLALAYALCLAPGPAGLPHPSFCYYGEILSPYGRPLMQSDQAQLVVRVGGRECGRTRLHEGIGPAINYRIEVPLDDGRKTNYVTYAARTGDLPEFVLLLGSQEYSLIDLESVQPIGSPGQLVRLDMVQDQDADSDGLPDTWELLILAAANNMTDIRQVRPEDDFDGDGLSNLQEFMAGTDPTWELDFLGIERILRDDQHGSLWFGFYTVPGKTYELQAGPLPGPLPAWQAVPFQLNSTNAPAVSYLRGDGYLNWLSVPLGTNTFTGFRLRVR